MELDAAKKIAHTQRLLLLCGMVSPALYAIADAVAGLSWAEYSFRDFTISELGAIGAPTRLLFSSILLPVYVLMVGFGVGVWRAGAQWRSIRFAGGFLIAFGLLALTVGQFASMQPRGVEQGVSGALHLIEGAVAMILVLSAMVSAAMALGARFRIYTMATIVIVLAFGAWSALDAPTVEAGLDTPWLGVKERIFWYSYELWFAVFAVMLLRKKRL